MCVKLYRLCSEGVECIFTAETQEEVDALIKISQNMTDMGFEMFATVMSS